MKKSFFASLIVAVMITASSIFLFNSCDNEMAKHFGGTLTVKVKEGYKVTEATWKDNQIWYFVEPMEKDYHPKTKEFIECSEYGVLEGKVVFVESKK